MATSTIESTTGVAKKPINTVVQHVTRPELRKFLVHFRRPLNASYDGSYGFDWLRDEYIYDVEQVIEEGDVPKRLYKGKEINSLIQEYTRLKSSDAQDLPEVKEIQPINKKPGNKEDYIPAWLAIFSTSNPINANGVDLYLQIDQEPDDGATPSPLADDGTILVFETSTGVEVSPTQIPLGKLLKQKQQSRVRNSSVAGLSTKTIAFYTDESVKINVKATHPDSGVGYVKVIAKLGNKTRHVGVLMIYPNSDIRKADVKAIEFCTTPGQNYVPTPTGYKDFLKSKSFNQALVRAEIIKDGVMNIADIKASFESRAKTGTLSAIETVQLYAIKGFLSKYKPGIGIPDADVGAFLEDIVRLLETFRATKFQNWEADNIGWIDSDEHKISFVIFTDYLVSDGIFDTQGVASVYDEISLDSACSNKPCFSRVWGNAVALFDQGNTDLITFAHELGHSFGLPHTFDDETLTKHDFYQGYTDNLMDYDDRPNPLSIVNVRLVNPFTTNMWALFKWQWDIVRNDKSLKKLSS